MKRAIRIGNSSGFWGDEPLAMDRQIRLGSLDYLTADYLAEVSMSILAKQQARHPELGYVLDFIEHVKISLNSLKGHFPKIVTNAGGNNPIECARALQALLSANGFHQKVMAVTGDGLMDRIIELQQYNNPFVNLESGAPFEAIKERLVAANAYTSSAGIVKALESGADIVVCGRASDSALTIGPLIYEMGWKRDDWDRLASAMIAGHVLECGAQACGGNFTDWEKVKDWDEMGYPIIEMSMDGSFIVTKPEGTGGLVNQWTVKEQLLYEIDDPSRYMGPDVVADLTTLKVEDLGKDRVQVQGVTGRPAPPTWKVSMAYKDGYKASGMVVVGGRAAMVKARLVRDIFWKRASLDFEKTSTNFIGGDALGASLANEETNEILLQFTAFDNEKEKLIGFSKEVAGLILSGPQGLAAYGSRPVIKEVIAFWPTLLDKNRIELKVWSMEHEEAKLISSIQAPEFLSETVEGKKLTSAPWHSNSTLLHHGKDKLEVQLKTLCLARSGDKGNSINLGVLARNGDIYEYLRDQLSVEVVQNWFLDICKGTIDRYELENLLAFNFVLHEALDGGGTKSGRLDPQGKMLASAFLAHKVFVPKAILDDV